MTEKKSYSDRSRLIIYLAVSFIFTFLWYFLANPKLLSWEEMGVERQNLVALLMMFPALAHLITRVLTGEGFAMTGKDSLMLGINLSQKRWIWFLLAMLLPWVYRELSCVIELLVCPKLFSLDRVKETGIDEKIVMLIPVNAIVSGTFVSFAAWGEEEGWRGYMMPKLFSLTGRKSAFLIGGVIWGLWHAPLTMIGHNFGTAYPGFPYVGILLMCLYCIIFGFLLTFLTERTGSIWPAVILHGVNNASPSILMAYVDTGKLGAGKEMLLSSVSHFLALLIVCAGVWFIWKKSSVKKS